MLIDQWWYTLDSNRTNFDTGNDTKHIPKLLCSKCVDKCFRVLTEMRCTSGFKFMGIREASAMF